MFPSYPKESLGSILVTKLSYRTVLFPTAALLESVQVPVRYGPLPYDVVQITCEKNPYNVW